jgi:glutaredoxin
MPWQQYEIRFINFRNSNINLVFNPTRRRILQIERQQTGITEYIQSPSIFLENTHRGGNPYFRPIHLAGDAESLNL